MNNGIPIAKTHCSIGGSLNPGIIKAHLTQRTDYFHLKVSFLATFIRIKFDAIGEANFERQERR
jgi:hypothetical protein